jgi:hypothetical protein
MKRFDSRIFVIGAFAVIALLAPISGKAQRRDYLSEKEADLVRDNQQIDLRIDILTKAIDRRLMVLAGQAEGPKDWQKSSDIWGDMPTGSRAALFTDIERLLQKSIDDIDDVAAHDRMDSKFFPKAMRALGKSAETYLPVLKSFMAKTKDEKEIGALLGSIESCDQIIAAVIKLPAEVKETKEQKKAKKDKKPSS